MDFKNYHNCIYILVNPLYAGYVKIGYATDLKSRLSSLNTGMLRNFEVYAIYETQANLADKQFHALIDELAPIVRAKVVAGQKFQDKEFFKLEPEQAYNLLNHIAIMTDTKDRLHKCIKDETKKFQIPVKLVTSSKKAQSKRPKYIKIGGINYQFETWKMSLITHCNKIIEKIGFENFKAKVLSFHLKSTRKVFSTIRDEVGHNGFYEFENGKLYMCSNYSSRTIININAILNKEFPDLVMEYVY